MTDLIFTGPSGTACLILAHGAGAGMDSPFMTDLSIALGERGIRVCRFEFAYMAERRRNGRRRPPPRAEKLIESYGEVIRAVRKSIGGQPLFIGGKSMGGRVATLVAANAFGEQLITGAAVVSYPFHPPKKPEALRTQHLQKIDYPLLIVQGERDPFGTKVEVPGFNIDPDIAFAWMVDGDHDLKPRRATGFTHSDNINQAAKDIQAFIDRHT